MDQDELVRRVLLKNIDYANLHHPETHRPDVSGRFHTESHDDYRVDTIVDGKVDGFVSFKRTRIVAAESRQAYHQDFQAVQLGRAKAKLHISINEKDIEKAWNIIHPILLKNQLDYFKVIKPGLSLSRLSEPRAEFAPISSTPEEGKVYFEVDTPSDNVSKRLKLMVLKGGKKKTLTLSSSYLESYCGIGAQALDQLQNTTEVSPATPIQSTLLKVLSDCRLIEHADQSGKDITVYVTSNMEKGRNDWGDILVSLTRELVQNQIRPGYYTADMGGRADVHVDGMSYVSYRYENTDQDLLGLQQVLAHAAERLQQEGIRQENPVQTRPWVPQNVQLLPVFARCVTPNQTDLTLTTEDIPQKSNQTLPASTSRDSRRPILRRREPPKGITKLKLGGSPGGDAP